MSLFSGYDTTAKFGFGGAIASGIGAYFGAANRRRAAAFNAEMANIQARMSEMSARFDEKTARAILRAGEVQQARRGLLAGKEVSSRRVSQAARGIAGATADEEIASVLLAKDIDRLQIDADTTRKAFGARFQGVNAMADAVSARNRGRMAQAQVEGTSPFFSGFNTLLDSATRVHSSWIRRTAPQYDPNEFLRRLGYV